MENYSDKDLVARCKTELPYQTASFEQLVFRYQKTVFVKVYSIIKNKEEAKDLSQDIFIKVFHGLPTFRNEASFSTWLYSITINTCLNHLDKMQRRPWWWLSEDIDEVRRDEYLDTELLYCIGKELERGELSHKIKLTLDALNGQSRAIIKLRFFEELDYKTIARRLGIGLSAAKMRLKRARQEFKLKYNQLNHEF